MSETSPSRAPLARSWLGLLGLAIAAAGAFFAYHGLQLATLGGSWYFLLAGIALILSGILILLARPLGGTLFILVWLATIPWSFLDAGFEFWPLISRLLAISVGAVVVLLSMPLLHRLAGRTVARAPFLGAAAGVAVACVAGILGMFQPHSTIRADAARAPALQPAANDPATANWTSYGGNGNHDSFAPADRINRDTVAGLEVAWTYRTGDLPPATAAGPRTRRRR